MAEDDGNHKFPARQPPFNWLEWLDEVASRLPRPPTWREPYSPFLLARYPHLRPQPAPDNPRIQQECEAEQASAFRIFQEWEERIAKDKTTAVCLKGLSKEQRRQLAALLLDTRVKFEKKEYQNASAAMRRHLAKEAPRRNRVLNRKLAAARKVLQELKDYASDSGTNTFPDERLHRAREILGHNRAVAASHALKALDLKDDGSAAVEYYRSIRDEYSTVKGVEAFGMVRLYWFFRHECHPPAGECEVRVALLRNTFWTEFGIPSVQYRPKYEGAHTKGKGCDDVRVTVARYRP